MSKPLVNCTKDRSNNFNLLRLIAAVMVLYGHMYPLYTGEASDPLSSFIGKGVSGIAVDVFFVISGFLVTSSLVFGNNLYRFIWYRVLRIYPALIVAVLFCVFGVGLYFTSLEANEYLKHPQTVKFLFGKSSIVGTVFTGGGSVLPGVFVGSPFTNSVNGSLWTLTWEVCMYVVLFVFGGVSYLLTSDCRKLLTIFCVSMFSLVSVMFLTNSFYQLYESKNIIDFIRFALLFFSGSLFFLFKERVFLSINFVIMVMAVLIVSIPLDLFSLVYQFSVGYLVITAAYVPIEKYLNFNRFGDYSYGIYIYAFPVQQSCVKLFPTKSVSSVFLMSLIITLLLSILSWHLIEKKALKLKHC